MKKNYKIVTQWFKEQISICSKATIYIAVILAITIPSITSCKKFVQIPPPETELVTSNVFGNNATATSALTNIYSQWTDDDYNNMYSLYPALSADELTNYNTTQVNVQLSTNSLNNMTFGGISTWSTGYNYIYQANAIIQSLQQYKGVSQAVKKQLTGEAFFVRGFWHFQISNYYGDAPIVTTTDYTVTDKLARSPRDQVLQQVINDLNQSYSLLNSNYVGVSDTLVSTLRVRPNKGAAAALLARAYLYLGDYSNNDISDYKNAETQATIVINNPLYALSPLTGPNSVFKINSTEAIFQLQTYSSTSNYATPEGQNYILQGDPTGNQTLSPQLLNAFEPNDQRFVNWVGSINVAGTIYYFPYKYQDFNVSTASEYDVVLRLGELYLIRAEARAEQGNITGSNGALADLNVIRNRAGLPDYAGAQDKASVLKAVLHERQIELFTEYGHRWFDLARATHTSSTVNINNVMGSPGNVCQSKGGIWNPDWSLYPVSLYEIQTDRSLSQNPGY